MVPIITIDGPSGAGKSTVSLKLARLLGYEYIDSGALYRIVALEAVQKRIAEDNEEELIPICENLEVAFLHKNEKIKILNRGEDISELIRSPEISIIASRISVRKNIRDCLTALQRKMAKNGRIVLEGRDAGTIVFPEAPVKFYLDATPDERGRRRFEELRQKGINVNLKEVTEDIIKRDHNDSSRRHAPLRPAPDAVIIDSSAMTVEEVVARMMEVIQSKKFRGYK